MEKISWIFIFLLHPISLALFVLSLSYIFFKNNRKLKFFFRILSLILFWILSTPLLFRPLAAALEDKYELLNVEEYTGEKKVNIIVLGGGTGHDSRLPPTSLLSSTSLQRLVEGLRIAKKIPSSTLITSGGARPGFRPLAYTAYYAAIDLGIDSSRLIALPTGRNTRQEAEAFVALRGKGAKVIVCTSAIHMPRAMEWFRLAGANPIPAPCDYYIKRNDPPEGLWIFIPKPDLWKAWQFVLKEHLGLFYFKIRGK